jgi:hypothetical protein
MIRIDRRSAVYGEVWHDEEPLGDSRVDIVMYRHRKVPLAHARSTPSLSLVTDLCVDEEAIADGFSKNCRYEIRRAEAKDGLRMELILDPESRLDEFRAFYDAFARQKSLPLSDRQWLVAACEARQLVLTVASRSAETLVWHAYVMSGKTARLLHSGSCFRNRESDYRALVGRANRWLHWRDMLRLKEMGTQRYDWGGLFEDESVAERAGINNFKKGFGGQQECTYDCTVPVSRRGRIWLPLRDTWRRWNPARK